MEKCQKCKSYEVLADAALCEPCILEEAGFREDAEALRKAEKARRLSALRGRIESAERLAMCAYKDESGALCIIGHMFDMAGRLNDLLPYGTTAMDTPHMAPMAEYISDYFGIPTYSIYRLQGMNDCWIKGREHRIKDDVLQEIGELIHKHG